MDGKHIVIRCPSKSGSEFYNYKKDYSVIVDANYKFIYIHVGTNGRVNDAVVFFLNQHLMKLYKQIPLICQQKEYLYVMMHSS
jgi:hypothetical protein